jgi:hypothetical protein
MRGIRTENVFLVRDSDGDVLAAFGGDTEATAYARPFNLSVQLVTLDLPMHGSFTPGSTPYIVTLTPDGGVVSSQPATSPANFRWDSDWSSIADDRKTARVYLWSSSPERAGETARSLRQYSPLHSWILEWEREQGNG